MAGPDRTLSDHPGFTQWPVTQRKDFLKPGSDRTDIGFFLTHSSEGEALFSRPMHIQHQALDRGDQR